MIRATILSSEVLNYYNCHSTSMCIELTSVTGINFTQYWIHCHFHISVQKEADKVTQTYLKLSQLLEIINHSV